MNFKRALLKSAGLLSLIFVGGASAHAVVILNFDTLVTGTIPGGSPPWATLSIANGGTDSVNMTLTHNASSAAGQFIGDLWLNMSPFPSNPAIIESSPKIEGANFSNNGITNAGLTFDMRVDFETSGSNGGINRLKPGQSVSWQITGGGLTEDAFRSVAGNSTNVFGMIHMQGIDDDDDDRTGGDDDSAKIAAVPEPSSMIGLAIATVALIGRKRRQA